MKIENKDQTILGLHANFDHDPSMYVPTGANKMYNKLGLSCAKLKLS